MNIRITITGTASGSTNMQTLSQAIQQALSEIASQHGVSNVKAVLVPIPAPVVITGS